MALRLVMDTNYFKNFDYSIIKLPFKPIKFGKSTVGTKKLQGQL